MTAVGELPVLDTTRCTGCGDCVAVCPTGCLALTGQRPRLPWLPRPLDCVACSVCQLVCPADAIRLRAE